MRSMILCTVSRLSPPTSKPPSLGSCLGSVKIGERRRLKTDSTIGGALIGVAAVVLMLFNGRVAGISGLRG
jgi:hypothetical protein